MADDKHPALGEDEKLEDADDVAELYDQGDEGLAVAADDLSDGSDDDEKLKLEELEDDVPSNKPGPNAAY